MASSRNQILLHQAHLMTIGLTMTVRVYSSYPMSCIAYVCIDHANENRNTVHTGATSITADDANLPSNDPTSASSDHTTTDARTSASAVVAGTFDKESDMSISGDGTPDPAIQNTGVTLAVGNSEASPTGNISSVDKPSNGNNTTLAGSDVTAPAQTVDTRGDAPTVTTGTNDATAESSDNAAIAKARKDKAIIKDSVHSMSTRTREGAIEKRSYAESGSKQPPAKRQRGLGTKTTVEKDSHDTHDSTGDAAEHMDMDIDDDEAEAEPYGYIKPDPDMPGPLYQAELPYYLPRNERVRILSMFTAYLWLNLQLATYTDIQVPLPSCCSWRKRDGISSGEGGSPSAFCNGMCLHNNNTTPLSVYHF